MVRKGFSHRMLERSLSETTINATADARAYHIVFLHRKLKKRAEDRYLVDIATGLKNSGCKVTIITSDLDPKDCLDEVNVRYKLH